MMDTIPQPCPICPIDCPVHLGTTLSPDQEVTDSIIISNGCGTGKFFLHPGHKCLDFHIEVANLSSPLLPGPPPPPGGGHFHCGAAGVNGPIIRTIQFVPAGNKFVAKGTWKSTDSEPLTPLNVAKLLTGQVYINVHTTNFPAGEVRGQIFYCPKDDGKKFDCLDRKVNCLDKKFHCFDKKFDGHDAVWKDDKFKRDGRCTCRIVHDDRDNKVDFHKKCDHRDRHRRCDHRDRHRRRDDRDKCDHDRRKECDRKKFYDDWCKCDKKFDHCDKKFDRCDKKFDRCDNKFDHCDKKFDHCDKRFDHRCVHDDYDDGFCHCWD